MVIHLKMGLSGSKLRSGISHRRSNQVIKSCSQPHWSLISCIYSWDFRPRAKDGVFSGLNFARFFLDR